MKRYLNKKEEKILEWRKKVLENGNHKCFQCYNTKNLHCHHIKPKKTYPELIFSIENGVVLCAACHIQEGKRNGEIDGIKTQFQKGMKPLFSFKNGLSPWNKGIKLSEETKKKMSLSRIGKSPSNKGIPKSEECKRKISEANRRSEDPDEIRICKECKISKRLEFFVKDKHLHRFLCKECRKKSRRIKNPNKSTQFKPGIQPWNKIRP